MKERRKENKKEEERWWDRVARARVTHALSVQQTFFLGPTEEH